jgi:hypothetical protein
MKHLREQYWAVEVPAKAKYHRIDGVPNGAFYELIFYKDSDDIDFPDEIQEVKIIDLPPGTWEIVCTSKNVTEEQASEIVDSSQWYFPVKHTRYVDYAFPFDREFKQRWSEGFGKAIDSLRSLLASKECDLNNNWLILKKQ